MKRFIALLLSICLLTMCCGCDLFGGNSSQVNSSKKQTPSTVSGDETSDTGEDDTDVSTASTSKKASKGSISLDGTASEEDIKALLDLSCSLTRSRKRKARKTENKGMEDDQ